MERDIAVARSPGAIHCRHAPTTPRTPNGARARWTSRRCEKHQPFPIMGVSAAKYARLCDSAGLRYSEAQWVAWAYPEAREMPNVYDFTKYCNQMKQATE